ncbi:hypothetical protein Taro_023116 [Colocasia esculenta]|uniref:Uncharacterized protein n=1 Tax=Colocasia esculenta TaxID=4460 RepID=A0A843VDI6_COLES|nr:hypothetical protein [Colocasia esculenta]
MQLVRALVSYYRQSHLNLLRAQVPLARQLFGVRRPENFAFGQPCRRLTAPSSSPSDDGILAHNSGVPKMGGKGSAEGRPPLPPAPKKRRFYAWTKWVFGSVVALVLSLWSTRWQKLLLIGSEVENAVKVVETAAEVVEEVAAAAEKVSAEVAEKLPADGKLKQMALAVEKASMEVVAGAETVEDIIHKVDELEQEVKTLLKPVIDPTKDHK